MMCSSTSVFSLNTILFYNQHALAAECREVLASNLQCALYSVIVLVV